MKDFEFRVSVPPPPVQWTFTVEQHDGKAYLSVERDGFRARVYEHPRIVVPVEALDAFCRKWLNR